MYSRDANRVNNLVTLFHLASYLCNQWHTFLKCLAQVRGVFCSQEWSKNKMQQPPIQRDYSVLTIVTQIRFCLLHPCDHNPNFGYEVQHITLDLKWVPASNPLSLHPLQGSARDPRKMLSPQCFPSCPRFRGLELHVSIFRFLTSCSNAADVSFPSHVMLDHISMMLCCTEKLLPRSAPHELSFLQLLSRGMLFNLSSPDFTNS